ncbi:MAG: DUF4215 domain-containing protein [bacterium]
MIPALTLAREPQEGFHELRATMANVPRSDGDMINRGLRVIAVIALGVGLVACVSETNSNNNQTACGNGLLNPGEQCDDGNTRDHDGCSSSCQVEGFCGNAVVEPGEECDDGNYRAGDGCDPSCNTEQGCGDGRLQVGEECDDDNLFDGDGCSALCQDEQLGAVCGNGILELGEGCDDANTVAGDGCGVDCEREDGCGNGTLDASEMCDDGNNVAGDGCSEVCRVEFVCGNGYCEEQNYETCYLCPRDCCPDCGDGELQAGEECDDGNNTDGDGCDKGCGDEDGVATCGNGIWEAGEECEDGNIEIHDGCSDTCEVEFVCGDQQCDSHMGETCKKCQPDCCPQCGNGVREVVHGEECDVTDLGGKTCADDYCYDGGQLACTAWCTIDTSQCSGSPPSCGDGLAECQEQCDLTDFKGKTCLSLGFSEGALACHSDCTYDLSGCTGLSWYFHDDFEDQNITLGNWTFAGDWEWGVPTGAGDEPAAAYEGSGCMGTNFGASYSSGSQYTSNRAQTAPIDLSAATQPELKFRMWRNFETGWDCFNVWVTVNGGAAWNLLTSPSVPYDSNEGSSDCWASTSTSWEEVVFDLSAFTGQTINLAFGVYSDSVIEYYGAYIDNVIVTEQGMNPVYFVTGQNLPRGAESIPYSETIVASGGTGSFGFSIVGGSNHAWLSIDPGTGVLSGTPGASDVGQVSVDVRVEEATLPSNYAVQTFLFEVVAPAALPYGEDFESGVPTAWVAGGDWEWGTPSNTGPAACHDGSSCVGTQIDALYSAGQSYATCVFESPPIDLTGTTTPTLSFFQWMYAQGGQDGGNIKVSTDNGNNWTLLTPAGGYDQTVGSEQAFTGDKRSSDWHRVLVDLSAYVGQVVNLQLAFRSDAVTQYDGWYVDAVTVTEAADVPVQLHTGLDLGVALVGMGYARQLVADGGTGSFDWSIQAGGVNDGWLSIDPGTGTLSGTPLAGNLGPVSVIVRAAAVGAPTNYDEQTYTLQVVTGIWLENFDSGATGWALNPDWEWGTPTVVGPSSCYGGSCLGLDLNANYSTNLLFSAAHATSPAIDLSGTTAPTLQFRSWLASEGFTYDGGNLKVSTDGVNFSVLSTVTPAYNLTIGGEAAWGGTAEAWSAQWAQFEADLSAYAGQTIYLRFAFQSDYIATFPGWYLDELIILD